MAYTGIDKEIYDSGTHFRPLQKYTQQQWTPPAIMGQNTNAGIAAIGGANPYKWPYPEGGGEGGADISGTQQGSWSPNQNLGPTNITDYEAEAAGVGSTWAGSWARAKDAYSKLPLPSNLLRKGIMKWRENREIKKQEKAAADQAAADQAAADQIRANQVQQNIQTYGNRDRPDTGMNAPGEGKGQSPTGGNVAGTPFAQGGRIGLRPGGIVDAGKQYYGKEDWEIQQINRYGVSYPEFLQNQFGKGLHEMDASEISLAVKAWDSWRSGQAEGGRIGMAKGKIPIPKAKKSGSFPWETSLIGLASLFNRRPLMLGKIKGINPGEYGTRQWRANKMKNLARMGGKWAGRTRFAAPALMNPWLMAPAALGLGAKYAVGKAFDPYRDETGKIGAEGHAQLASAARAREALMAQRNTARQNRRDGGLAGIL